MRKHYDYLYFKYYEVVVRELIWDSPDSKVQASLLLDYALKKVIKYNFLNDLFLFLLDIN